MTPNSRRPKDKTIDWTLATWPVLVGAVILAFSQRFTTSAWRFAFGVPGGYLVWGWLLVGLGAIMLYCLRKRQTVLAPSRCNAAYLSGLMFVGLWWALLGAVFLVTAIRDPMANPLGVVVWTPIGLFYWWWAWNLSKFR